MCQVIEVVGQYNVWLQCSKSADLGISRSWFALKLNYTQPHIIQLGPKNKAKKQGLLCISRHIDTARIAVLFVCFGSCSVLCPSVQNTFLS